MPWKEADLMKIKYEFILKSFNKDKTFTELCRDFGISTKTGYKWRQRFLEGGYSNMVWWFLYWSCWQNNRLNILWVREYQGTKSTIKCYRCVDTFSLPMCSGCTTCPTYRRSRASMLSILKNHFAICCWNKQCSHQYFQVETTM